MPASTPPTSSAKPSLGDAAARRSPPAFQPNPDILWVGTGERANRQSASWGDGIYKSTDAGKTWTNVGPRDSRHICPRQV